MTLNEILSLISPALAIATFFIGRASASKADGKQDGVILTEIGYLKKGNDDIIRKMEEQDNKYNELDRRVTAVTESAKQAHKRIDELHSRTKE